jgi:hypothetical protein
MVVHQDKGVNLGPQPLRQFRNQSEEHPAIIVPAKEGLPAVPTAHHMIPTINNVDAQRSGHLASLSVDGQLSLIRD